MKRPAWTAILLLACLALFSLVFSLLAERGLWPGLPAGALHNTDLWAGLVAGVALLLLFVKGNEPRRGRVGEGESGRRGKIEAQMADHAIAVAPSPSPSPPLGDSGRP